MRSQALLQMQRATIGISILMFAQWHCWVAKAVGPLEPWPHEFRSDADLHDIFFLDASAGWAVGDRGTIRSTVDGGRNWRLQRCPVGCRLNSVHFTDSKRGWIVGGWTHPYTHRSHGVVLSTDNGGTTWTQLESYDLPALRGVFFVDARNGMAAGFGNPLYPSGCFTSVDGGRSWQTVFADMSHDWLGVAFSENQTGFFVSSMGAVAKLSDRRLSLLRSEATRLRQFRGISARRAGHAVLVGDGGLVISTRNSGESWTNHTPRLSHKISQQFDFAAVDAIADDIWLAGRPGTLVFRSADGGTTWDEFETGQSMPLDGLHFIDHNVGWAIGANGTILHTTDGGSGWTIQHQANDRVAMLGIFTSGEEIPFELLAQASAVSNYRTRCLLVGQARAGTDLHRSPAPIRAHEALVHLGCGGAQSLWGFKLPPLGMRLPISTIEDQWSTDHRRIRLKPDGVDQLKQRIVSSIRQWKPSVILTSTMDAGQLESLSATVVQAVAESSQLDAYPDQIQSARLSTWQVPLAFALTPNDNGHPALRLSADEISVPLSTSVRDLVHHARNLVMQGSSSSTAEIRVEAIVGDASPTNVQSIFQASGLRLSSEQRRRSTSHNRTDADALRRANQRNENVRAILSRAAKSRASGGAWLAQVDAMLAGFNGPGTLNPAAGNVLVDLIATVRGQHELSTAIDLVELLARRFPNHPALETTLTGLLAELTSVEHALQRRGSQPRGSQPKGTDASAANALPTVNTTSGNGSVAPGRNAYGRPRPAVLNGSPRDTSTGFEQSDHVARLTALIDQLGPGVAAEPNLQLTLARALERNANPDNKYRATLKRLAVTQSDPHWRACALGELWLMGEEKKLYKPLLKCSQAPAPHLDGVHEDATWDAAEGILFGRGDPSTFEASTKVAFARDASFLYLAIECGKVNSVEYPSAKRPRPHDPDLSERDRLHIYLDVDRDYSTAWRITVDSRGWTGESLGKDTSWNPNWYVASHEDEESWSVEAAIAFAQLGSDRPATRSTWGLGMERIAPGSGRQAWPPQLAEPGQQERFAFLLFD